MEEEDIYGFDRMMNKNRTKNNVIINDKIINTHLHDVNHQNKSVSDREKISENEKIKMDIEAKKERDKLKAKLLKMTKNDMEQDKKVLKTDSVSETESD